MSSGALFRSESAVSRNSHPWAGQAAETDIPQLGSSASPTPLPIVLQTLPLESRPFQRRPAVLRTFGMEQRWVRSSAISQPGLQPRPTFPLAQRWEVRVACKEGSGWWCFVFFLPNWEPAKPTSFPSSGVRGTSCWGAQSPACTPTVQATHGGMWHLPEKLLWEPARQRQCL